MLTNDVVRFQQPGPDQYVSLGPKYVKSILSKDFYIVSLLHAGDLLLKEIYNSKFYFCNYF